MTWVLVVAVAWLLLSVVVALSLGRAIRLARRTAEAVETPNFVVDPLPASPYGTDPQPTEPGPSTAGGPPVPRG
jgi:hypothetical protein